MIPLPIKFNITKESENKAVFEISPLYTTYGVTVGNALRRVLLSSMSGYAITQVKIKGVLHEFSTLPGILEDIPIVLVNLRKLRFKCFSDEPQTVTLSVKGERKAKGADFKLNPQVKLANPEQHIATLTSSKAELSIEAKIEKGFGYVRVEDREEKKAEAGTIYIDSIFNPVKRVSYKIENMIVGKRTDFERLKLKVETDGTASPEEVFYEAVEILMNHLSICAKPLSKESSTEEQQKAVVKTKEKEKEAKKKKVEDLKIPAKTQKALLKAGIKTCAGLLQKTKEKILSLDGIGKKELKDIEKALKAEGLSLKN